MCWTLSEHSLTSCTISVVVLRSGFFKAFWDHIWVVWFLRRLETASGLSGSWGAFVLSHLEMTSGLSGSWGALRPRLGCLVLEAPWDDGWVVGVLRLFGLEAPWDRIWAVWVLRLRLGCLVLEAPWDLFSRINITGAFLPDEWCCTIRTRCYINVRSKANMSQLTLPHECPFYDNVRDLPKKIWSTDQSRKIINCDCTVSCRLSSQTIR